MRLEQEPTGRPVSASKGRWGEYTQLSRQIRQAGLLDRRRGWYAARIGLNLALLVAGWAVFVVIGESWWQLVTAAYLAVVFTQIAFVWNPASSNPATSPSPNTADLIGPATQPSRHPETRWNTPPHQQASQQEAPMDRDDHTTDTGMLGSEAENPGPGRDTNRTGPDPAETSSEHPTRTVGMSGADPQRTRLGTQETSGRPLAGAPQDTTSSGDADTGMVGSEAENPGPGRDTRRTDPAATAGADDPETTAAMSGADPDRTRLGSHERGHAQH